MTGETISSGGISGGTKVANGYILNTQGYLTAGNNINITTGNFYNMRDVTVGGSGPYTFTENDTQTDLSTDTWSRLSVEDPGPITNFTRTHSTQSITGSSSSVYGAGNIVIDATTFLNRLSTIEAGQNLTVTSTTFNNQTATLPSSRYRDTYGSYGTNGWVRFAAPTGQAAHPGREKRYPLEQRGVSRTPMRALAGFRGLTATRRIPHRFFAPAIA